MKWAVLGLAGAVLVGVAVLANRLGKDEIESFDFSDDGRITVYCERRSHRIFLDDGSGKPKLIDEGSNPTLGKDNVVYVSRPGSKSPGLMVRNARGGVSSLLGIGSVLDGQPAFSRDGNNVNFVQSNRIRPYSMGGEVQTDFILMRSTLSGDVRPLIKEKFFHMVLRPGSDDGTYVYFTGTKTPSDSEAIYRVRVNDPKSLERIAWLDTLDQVVVNPTRNMIAFTDRREGGRYFVKLARKDGTEVKTLSNTAAEQLRFYKGGSSLAILDSRLEGNPGIRSFVIP